MADPKSFLHSTVPKLRITWAQWFWFAALSHRLLLFLEYYNSAAKQTESSSDG
jgi:hypothetical protein